MSKNNILLIGANGQIGSVLSRSLQQKYGKDCLIASDINPSKQEDLLFEQFDVLDRSKLDSIIQKHKITQIYHLAAILSAKGESNPLRSWNLNMNSLFNVLEAAKSNDVEKVFFPSSIAVFGLKTSGLPTMQDALPDPATVYGISKNAGELWCQYYHQKYGMDIRSLRYPGVIGHQSNAGGGTTDYAVEIFHEAIVNSEYTSFLNPNTRLPMIYMDDAIRATLELMEAPKEKIHIRTSYNISGLSFTPAELAREIQKHLPDFHMKYEADFRQEIADGWPKIIDDFEANQDWNWKAKWDLTDMVNDMLENLTLKYRSNTSC